MLKTFRMIDGKVYEVTGKDGDGRDTVKFRPDLKSIPEDKPIIPEPTVPTFTEIVETEEKPKRRTRKK